MKPFLLSYTISIWKKIGGLRQICTNFDGQRIPNSIPPFYKQLLTPWSDYTQVNPEDLLTILNQSVWNNRFIKADKISIFYKPFSELNINKVVELCDNKGDFTWTHAKKNRGIQDKDYLKWAGIIHTIPKAWKNNIKEQQENIAKIKNQTDKCLVKKYFGGRRKNNNKRDLRANYTRKICKADSPS